MLMSVPGKMFCSVILNRLMAAVDQHLWEEQEDEGLLVDLRLLTMLLQSHYGKF